MPRSAAKRRERRDAVAQGAARKPPETYQPSEHAAAVRSVMYDSVNEQMEPMRAAMRTVKSVPLDFASPVTVDEYVERAERLHDRAPWLPELDALLAEAKASG
jgi:hypothetical protein